jgi:hypothetical protein
MIADRFDLCDSNRLVHFSIDDVGASLRWLCQNRPAHIWDMRFFGKLQEFNTKYGTEFTLYIFYDIGSGSVVGDIPQRYADDFLACANWLKFGFHSRNSERFENDNHYKSSYELMQAAIQVLGMGKTDILRLHYWKATAEQKCFLHKAGVRSLLCPSQDEKYENGKYCENGIIHRKTDVCFERLSKVDCAALAVGNPIIAAFTHEKLFEQQIEKIEAALDIFVKNEYVFFS